MTPKFARRRTQLGDRTLFVLKAATARAPHGARIKRRETTPDIRLAALMDSTFSQVRTIGSLFEAGRDDEGAATNS